MKLFSSRNGWLRTNRAKPSICPENTLSGPVVLPALLENAVLVETMWLFFARC
jgi:hypothetical protein